MKYYLSTSARKKEVFVVVGDQGELQVFNDTSASYEDGSLVNDKGESLQDGMNCVISKMEVSGSNLSSISMNGFQLQFDSSETKIQVEMVPREFLTKYNIMNLIFSVQINVNELAYPREDYNGEIFKMTLTCCSNESLVCLVFKLNGTKSFIKGQLIQYV